MTAVLVKHIMTAPVIGLFAEQTMPLVEDIMKLKHLRHIPVLEDDGTLAGLVSHRDLLRAQVSTLTGLTESQRRARQEDVRVASIMTRDIWTVTPETLASVAGRTLLDHRFGCLPVIGDQRKVVGIVTERDFMRFAIRALEMHD
jgi:CBS domain-containing protein